MSKVMQSHHIIYKNEGRKGNRYDVEVDVRKGLHQVLTLLSRFNGLSDKELLAIITQALIQYLAGKK
jgi:hypothetical protein